MGFPKGHKLSGSRKGKENKTTGKAKELFISIMEGEVDYIKQSLELVRRKNPADYLNVLSKFYPYFMPKQIDMTSGGEAFVPPNIIAPNGGHKP
jgi:hypothetical protein